MAARMLYVISTAGWITSALSCVNARTGMPIFATVLATCNVLLLSAFLRVYNLFTLIRS